MSLVMTVPIPPGRRKLVCGVEVFPKLDELWAAKSRQEAGASAASSLAYPKTWAEPQLSQGSMTRQSSFAKRAIACRQERSRNAEWLVATTTASASRTASSNGAVG